MAVCPQKVEGVAHLVGIKVSGMNQWQCHPMPEDGKRTFVHTRESFLSLKIRQTVRTSRPVLMFAPPIAFTSKHFRVLWLYQVQR